MPHAHPQCRPSRPTPRRGRNASFARLLQCWALLTALALPLGAAENPLASPKLWAAYFPDGASAEPIKALDNKACAILDDTGETLGWVFRTDQIAPSVSGYGGPIGVLVALSRNQTILGLRILVANENPSLLNKLSDEFFEQFLNRPVADDYKTIFAVTGATVSSEAIIKDVFLSARHFLKTSPVREILKQGLKEEEAPPLPASEPSSR